MFCKTCGTQIPEGSTFCPGCGAAAEAQPAQQYQQPVQQYQQPAQQYQQPAQQYQQPVQQYQQVQPVQQPTNTRQTRIIPGFMILAILVPAFGIVMGIINLCKKNTRPGRAYLIAGIVSSVVISALCTAILVPTMLEYIEESRYYNYYY